MRALALQQAILDSASFALIATDEKGIIQLFNRGAERALGYAAADVVNRVTPSDLHDPCEVRARAQALSLELATPISPGFQALAFKASRGIEDIYELTCIRKDGSRFPAVVSITALRDAHDAIIGYLLISSDNSGRKRVEAALIDAIAVAEKANLAKSEFLSSMSHELRTPLNAVLGFTQLIDGGTPPPSESQQRSIDQILQAGWYLLDLVNEILDLALIESGKLTLALEPVPIVEILRECHLMIEPMARKHGIRVRVPEGATADHVSADRTRLKQVVVNLLSNAVKYNRPGGYVTMACVADGHGRVRVGIEDTGEGLTAHQIAQLFQPFNRLGQAEKVQEGTGIGLVVSRQLVECMGGTIGVESVVGQGSKFWIDLPAAKPAPVALHATMIPDTLPHHDAGLMRLKTLLYLEDDPEKLTPLMDALNAALKVAKGEPKLVLVEKAI